MSIFGTRPEAIKMAPVIKELEKFPGLIESRVIVTAQHREMLDQVLQLFEIIPDADLNIMKANQSPSTVFAEVLSGIEPVLHKYKPDWILLQGDTTTVAAVSIAAYHERVRVGHVEAGLRTKDKWQPFPEEINRRIAGVVADMHFAPTPYAMQNLLAEGVPADSVFVTGNPVIDALHWVAKQPYDFNGLLGSHSKEKLVLVTVHRRENFGQPLENICHALRDLAKRYAGRFHFVYPVHLNPNVRKTAYRLLQGLHNFTLLPPLDYLSLVNLMKRSILVMTDSGGIQEEAPGLGKPVLVLREKTERPEAVEAGTVKVVGTKRKIIVAEAEKLLTDEREYQKMANAVNPYGDGMAARRIVQALLNEKIVPFEPGPASIIKSA